jgi:cyclophilin family peptidyl-prolyl cis-trans isomerase
VRRAILFGLVGVLVATGCGGDDDGGASAGSTATSAGTDSTAPAQVSAACRRVPAPAPRPEGAQRRPPVANLSPDKRYEVTFWTNCGRFTVLVDQKAAPATAASFVSLARKGFFDGTVFHRIVPGFVIQGGDPTGSGQGGPGYTTTDKPPADTVYKRGMVAMAKTGAEPAGTAGSQFFVVLGRAPDLAPEYATLGRIASGLDVVEQIGQLGDPSSGGAGTPLEPVVIRRAKVTG